MIESGLSRANAQGLRGLQIGVCYFAMLGFQTPSITVSVGRVGSSAKHAAEHALRDLRGPSLKPALGPRSSVVSRLETSTRVWPCGLQ
eukprot:4309379-Alexandrium_andersonii.AAC.1